MQEILYGIVNCEHLQKSDEKPAHILQRFPFIEQGVEPFCGVKILEDMPSPRLIKTHLRKYFFVQPLEQKNKIVVVLRNVKDAIVSFYHHYQFQKTCRFEGRDFNEFFELFREKHLVYGDWYDWVLDWWTEKENPNVCFVFYEDMKENIHKETRRVVQFLGIDLTDDQIQFVVDRANFDAMKKKRMVIDKNEEEGKGHFRKGVVGDWRSHFSEEQAQYVDKLTAEKLEGTGLHFKESWIQHHFTWHGRFLTVIGHTCYEQEHYNVPLDLVFDRNIVSGGCLFDKSHNAPVLYRQYTLFWQKCERVYISLTKFVWYIVGFVTSIGIYREIIHVLFVGHV